MRRVATEIWSCRWHVTANEGPNCSRNSCVGSHEGPDPIGGTGICTIPLVNKEPWTCSVFFRKYVFFCLKKIFYCLYLTVHHIWSWVMDSSASDHIASNKSLLSDINHFQSLPTITLANGSQAMATRASQSNPLSSLTLIIFFLSLVILLAFCWSVIWLEHYIVSSHSFITSLLKRPRYRKNDWRKVWVSWTVLSQFSQFHYSLFGLRPSRFFWES